MSVLVRLQASSDPAKQKRQRQELFNSGSVATHVILAQLKDGGFHIVSMGMKPEDIGLALVAAAEGLVHHRGQESAIRLRAQGIGETMNPGTGSYAGPARKQREVGTDAAGNLKPPPGESFIRCGECENPGFFIANHEADDTPARFVCAKCGNEIKLLRVTHGE
jgi:ribosomal protein S27AE